MPNKLDIGRDAINLVSTHVNQYEEEVTFVTEKVAFEMRNLIRQCRKNYWGVYDDPNDPTTGRKKVWIPLTQSAVDAVVKNIDLDTKDVNFRATVPTAIGTVSLIRSIVRSWLDKHRFGEELDLMERDLAIDGTVVWKTVEGKDEKGKRTALLSQVDLLNFYIDPTSKDIQSATAVVERALYTAEDLKATDWENTKDLEGTTGLHPTDRDLTKDSPNDTTEMIDVYEYWGRMPKSLITGKEKDRDEYVEGHIIVSGLDRDSGSRWHLIEENKSGKRPYEECWYQRVSGRWYGRGVAESLLMLQTWVNTIINIRINRSYVSQLGIFKIKKGSGVTPQMLGRLASNGAVTVNAMDDIQQFVMQEASQASYADEQNIQGWAERVTSTFEAVTGEALPASTPATNAVLQARTASSQFVFIKKGIGLFIERWADRHFLPIIMKNIKIGDVIRVTDEVEYLRERDQMVVDSLLIEAVTELQQNGVYVSPEVILRERELALRKLSRMGNDRFVELKNKLDLTDYEVKVYVTNEEMDKAVMGQSLLTVLQSVPDPQVQRTVLRQIFDLMGLDVNSLTPEVQPSAPQPQGPQGAPEVAPQALATPTEQQITTAANVL